MNNKCVLLVVCFCLGIIPAIALPTPQEITTKINENNAKILDLQATMITTIKSSMLGGQPITQRATFYKKGSDKSRVEMMIPAIAGQPAKKQTTITNGDDTWLIGSDGQVVESPMAANKAANIANNTNAKDPTAYLRYFELTVTEVSNNYLIIGTPKSGTELSNNQYFGSIKMYIDKARYVPVQMQIYKQGGSLLMESAMTYVQIKEISVNDKSVTKMTIDMPSVGANSRSFNVFGGNAQTMEIVVEYKGLKVNEGLGDGLFRP